MIDYLAIKNGRLIFYVDFNYDGFDFFKIYFITKKRSEMMSFLLKQ